MDRQAGFRADGERQGLRVGAHLRGYILTQAKRFARLPFRIGFAARMEPHRKSPACVSIQEPHRTQSAKRGIGILACSAGAEAKFSGVKSDMFRLVKNNARIRFRRSVDHCGDCRNLTRCPFGDALQGRYVRKQFFPACAADGQGCAGRTFDRGRFATCEMLVWHGD